MDQSLKSAVFLAAVCVLYVIGYVVMSATPAPWGFLWLPPLAVAAGAAWHLFERIEAYFFRRRRERAERQG